jgi:hypothetical protein
VPTENAASRRFWTVNAKCEVEISSLRDAVFVRVFLFSNRRAGFQELRQVRGRSTRQRIG